MEYTAASIIASLKEGYVDPAIIATWIVNCMDSRELIQVLPNALVNEDDRITKELQMVISALPAFAGSNVDLPRDVERLRHGPACKRARFA